MVYICFGQNSRCTTPAVPGPGAGNADMTWTPGLRRCRRARPTHAPLNAGGAPFQALVGMHDSVRRVPREHVCGVCSDVAQIYVSIGSPTGFSAFKLAVTAGVAPVLTAGSPVAAAQVCRAERWGARAHNVAGLGQRDQYRGVLGARCCHGVLSLSARARAAVTDGAERRCRPVPPWLLQSCTACTRSRPRGCHRVISSSECPGCLSDGRQRQLRFVARRAAYARCWTS